MLRSQKGNTDLMLRLRTGTGFTGIDSVGNGKIRLKYFEIGTWY